MNPTNTPLAQGTISTQNIGSPNGNAVTQNSTVSCDLNGGFSTAAIQVVGTYTGALSVQVKLENGTWVTLAGATALINASNNTQSATIASGTQGIFQLDVAAFTGVRVTALAAVTGSATVYILAGAADGVTGIDTPVVLASGSNSIGTVATPVGTALSVVTTASTNASSQKATAGNLFELACSNPTATAAYVKFYNKATAPTVGTDVPVLTVPVGAGATVTIPFGNIGKRFATGIAMAVTAAAAATDTGVAVAGVQIHGSYV